MRLAKGWNNASQHRKIIRILGLILQPYMSTRQPILSFDAAPLHLHDGVLTELEAVGIWYLVIPARLTWMLQPLDTHAFVLFKNFLRRKFTDRSSLGEGRPSTRRMCLYVIDAIRYVLQGKNWKKAFKQNGLSDDLSGVSAFIRHQLAIQDVPVVPALCPTSAQLQLCWPRNKPFKEDVVFRGLPNHVLALEDVGPAVLPLGLATRAMVPLPAPPGASLLVAALAAGPAFDAPANHVSEGSQLTLPDNTAIMEEASAAVASSSAAPRYRL